MSDEGSHTPMERGRHEGRGQCGVKKNGGSREGQVSANVQRPAPPDYHHPRHGLSRVLLRGPSLCSLSHLVLPFVPYYTPRLMSWLTQGISLGPQCQRAVTPTP